MKQCLLKSGLVLELTVYLAALEAADSRGRSVYNDVQTGVYIDWDGRISDDPTIGSGAANEVDVIMMHGMVPLFVSCKNGQTEVEELYKLNSVAGKFGGKYACKYLIAPLLRQSPNESVIRERCRDLSINIVDDAAMLSEEEFFKRIKTLYNYKPSGAPQFPAGR